MLETEHRRSTSIRLMAKREQDAHTISFHQRQAVRNASREENTAETHLAAVITIYHNPFAEDGHVVGSWQPHTELRRDDS